MTVAVGTCYKNAASTLALRCYYRYCFQLLLIFAAFPLPPPPQVTYSPSNSSSAANIGPLFSYSTSYSIKQLQNVWKLCWRQGQCPAVNSWVWLRRPSIMEAGLWAKIWNLDLPNTVQECTPRLLCSLTPDVDHVCCNYTIILYHWRIPIQKVFGKGGNITERLMKRPK